MIYFAHIEMPSGPDMPSYYPREEERSGLRVIRDTDSINASYDRYLRSGVFTLPPFPLKYVWLNMFIC